MSIHGVDTLRPDSTLAFSAQYLRAWRKFVERIPRYSGETVAVDALPLTSFQLSTTKDENLSQVPGIKLLSALKEVKFADILAVFLFPWHEQPAVDKQQRAKRLNELYAQRPTFDETEFTVGDLKAYFRRILPEVQADCFELLFAGKDLWIPDRFTLLSVWTDPARHSGFIGLRVSLGLCRAPLRIAIGIQHTTYMEFCPEYVGPAGEPSSDRDNSLRPIIPNHQLCNGTELCTPLNFLSPQHAAAWYKYVARDSRFAKDPISYKDFIECVTLAFTDSLGAPYQCFAQPPLHKLCGEIELTKLVEIFLVPDATASREQQASAINELYAVRPDF